MTHIPGHLEPHMPPAQYGFGVGPQPFSPLGLQPFSPFGGFATPGLSNPNPSFTGPWYNHPVTQLAPVLGTALHWNQMGPWEKAASTAFDLADIASLGSMKPATAALRSIGSVPNPLGVVRRLPGWDKDQYFMRTGRPPGSGIQARGFKPQVVLGELGNYPIPPPAYTDLPVKPSAALGATREELPGISVNWGQPGGYDLEKGVSSYMAKPFDPSELPLSTGAFNVAEEVPIGAPFSGTVEKYPLTTPTGRPFGENVSKYGDIDNPNLMVLRNPEEYLYSLGKGNLPTTRSPIDLQGKAVPKKLQQHWMMQGMADKLTGPVGKGTYRMEGKAVPELGADLEHLMDYYPTIKQLQRFDARDIAIASPSYSAQIFGHLDPYGRKLIPGGDKPFSAFADMPQLVEAPEQVIAATQALRALNAGAYANYMPQLDTVPDQAIEVAKAMRAINAYMGDKRKKPSRGNGDTGG